MKRASRQPSHFVIQGARACVFFFFFLGAFLLRASFCIVWLAATLRAPFRCVRFTEVNEDGEVRSLVRFPYWRFFFVKLEASMLGYTPV